MIGSKRSDLREILGVIGRLVWNENIEPQEFEDRWTDMVHDFDLTKNTWLEHIFDLREYWVCAYFRDMMLGGRLRTTSIAESQNSFFKKFSNRQLTIVELLMQFDGAIDKQRNEQAKLNFKSSTTSPPLKTPWLIEKNAADVYTMNVFFDIQDEIYNAGFFCELVMASEDRPSTTFKVKDRAKQIHELQHRVSDGYISCTCKMFERLGIPCQHLFVVFRYLGLETIPDCMVLSRWTKAPYQKHVGSDDDGDVNLCGGLKEKQALVKEMWSSLFSCVGLVDGNVDRMRDFIATLNEMQNKYKSDVGGGPNAISNTVSMVETFTGISLPSEINVHPPDHAKNKGSGKRLKGRKEKAVEESQKRKRQCTRCKKYAGHDIRTCKAIL